MAEKVKYNEIEFKYLPTGELILDILTKPLTGKKFYSLRNKLLNWE